MIFDTIIIGGGLAGIALALRLAEHHKVGLLTKQTLQQSNSAQAQGGIAVVLDNADSIHTHIQDTLLAGDGLCDPCSTRFIIEHAKTAIEWLLAQGVPFTQDQTHPTGYHLTQEGGHSHRRIIHAHDATGAVVMDTLIHQACHHPNLHILENYIAIDLITTHALHPNLQAPQQNQVYGVYAYHTDSSKMMTLSAQQTVLACGGAGKVYLYTTNPDTATGDGVAMGWRAGCRVRNMEFMQFHPTCLYHPQAKSFLISEAIRGEGGLLQRPDGTCFMHEYDSRKELAPRDIVARAIDFEMKKWGLDCVYLDIRHRGTDFIQSHFPTIYAFCLKLGIDITQHPIPVVPAMHFTCGGLVTNLHGQTDIANLYAIGEVASIGLHGANRLASNSLLECLVMAQAAAQHILHHPCTLPQHALPDWDSSHVNPAVENIVIAHNWDALRRTMWDYVGIVRSDERLQLALKRITLLADEVNDYYSRFHIHPDLIELRNLVQVAELIVRSALQRRESRGLHFNKDTPYKLPSALDTVLCPAPRRPH